MEIAEIDSGNLAKKDLLSLELIDALMDCASILEREQKIQECEERAEELGVKTRFNALIRAAKQEKKRLDKLDKTPYGKSNYIEYSDIDENMFCGAWVATDQGVCKYTDYGIVTACPHPVYISERYINVQTGCEKVKLRFRKRYGWRDIIVEKSKIASSSKIVSLADNGLGVTSENARLLVQFLSDLENFNIETIPEKKSTSKLGWCQGDFIPYDLSVTFDDTDKFETVYKSIRQSGSEKAWYELADKIRHSGRFEPRLYLAASFASVLIEPLNALPFIVNLWGETGTGKTVALMLAASVWAFPGNGGFIPKAKATETSLEVRLDFLNNFPLMFDDMAQLKDRYGDNFSDFIYMLCSGRSKERSNRDLGLNRAATWSNVILTNGERPLAAESMQGGAVNRVIDVEMDQGSLFEDGNAVVGILENNYGFAGKTFIDAVKTIGLDQLKEMQQAYLEQIKTAAEEAGDVKEEKQMIPLSILLTADWIAADCVFKDGLYLDFDKCFQLIRNKNDVSENQRAYEYIISEISINDGYFQHERFGKGGVTETVRAANNQTWGVITDSYAVIQKNVFRRICDNANCSYRAFLGWAKQHGLIEAEEGRFDKRKQVNGRQMRCIWLKIINDDEAMIDDDFTPLNSDEKPPDF